MEPKFYTNGYSRSTRFFLQDREFVTVLQSSSLGDKKLERATVNWSACGSVSPDTADEFMVIVRSAIQLAKKWNEDTGKLAAEVLK